MLVARVVAALRESKKPMPALPVRPAWHLVIGAFLLGFFLGATLILVTRVTR